jgi:translation initiation factor IF-3
MLEISSLPPVCPVIKPGKIKKDDHLSEQPQRKKKQAMDVQETQPVQHIDEIV